MSILSAIARNLLRQEMQSRKEKKQHRFAIHNHHVGVEVVCTGDWRERNAPNLDLQIISDRLGLCLSLFGYEGWQVQRSGGAKWLFRSQNGQLLENRQNVTLIRPEYWEQVGEKTVYRTTYRANYQNTPCIYLFSVVSFPQKGTCVWMMLNGVAKNVEEHGAVFDQLIEDLVCLDPDLEPEEQNSGLSLAERVGAALGLEYEILPPQTSDRELVRIWSMAARPGVQPLLLLPDECFLNAAPLPEYPQPGEAGWPDGAEFLKKRLEELKEGFDHSQEDQAVWQEIMAPDTSGQIVMESHKLFVHWEEVQKAGGLLLLQVPAAHPWDVFRRVPFGGFNACPDNLEQMAVCQYWHGSYGAAPILLGRDTLQFYLQKQPPEQRLYQLACEMFAFSEDLVFQGVETVGGLEPLLRGSNFWFFWWD